MEATKAFVRRFKYLDLFDGNRHELVAGRDFDGSVKAVQNSVVASARYYGVRVQTSCFDGSLFVRSFSLCLKEVEQDMENQASSVE